MASQKEKLAYFCCAHQEHLPVTINTLESAKRYLQKVTAGGV